MAELDHLKLLADMYASTYFPDHLVDRVKATLLGVAKSAQDGNIESLEQLYVLTHAATEEINELQNAFYEAGSEIETGARESIGQSFVELANALGFPDADIEELIAPRDW